MPSSPPDAWTRRAGLRLLGAGAVGAWASRSPAQDRSPAAFYRGRQITLVIGNGPGGGFDVFGRLLARHIGRYIPGYPSVVVENMPGAGSLVAANHLYNLAPKDGSVFGLIARNMPLLGLLGRNPNVRFDPSRFTWLGSSSDFSTDAYLLIARKDAAVQSIRQAVQPGGPALVLGGTTDGGSSSDVPRILHDTIGLNADIIAGYRDSAAIYLAIESGEVSGRTNELSSLKTSRPAWLKPDGGYRVLLQYARATRHPDFPDVPTARELARDDVARGLIAFTEAPFAMAWPYAAPPGVPEDRAQALQTAFMAVHKDPDFLADAARMRVEVNPIDAAALSEKIAAMSRASNETLDYMRKLLSSSRG